MSKILEYGSDVREKILSGVEKLTNAVKVTMGPMGKNVIIGRAVGAPSITKDGVSVAREVVLEDPIEELGCQLVKEAAGRTAVVGDGTTTSTVLTHAIFKEGLTLINSGYSPLNFREGIFWAKKTILEELSKLTKTLDSDEDLINIATISTNNDSRLGRIIGEAYIAVNRDGLITAEAIPNAQDHVRIIDGLELKSGYHSQAFLEVGESQRELNDAYILICNWEISAVGTDPDFLSLIQKLANAKKDVLLLCKDLKKEGLATLLANFKQGTLKVCPIKIPKMGKQQQGWLEDLSALTGATILGGDDGLSLTDFNLNCCGFAKKIIVDGFKTRIFEASKNEKLVADKIRTYKEVSSHLIGETDFHDIQARLGFLSSKTAVVMVGYHTELELREKGDRVEDAIFAVKAALEEGYVVGGGFALLRAARAVEKRINEIPVELHPAVFVLLEACERPAKQIIENSGRNSEEILSKLEANFNFGYNTAIGKYGDLIEMGIIDPKKVTRTALENATSIAFLLITTEAAIADNPKNPSSWQPVAGYRIPNESGLNHKY